MAMSGADDGMVDVLAAALNDRPHSSSFVARSRKSFTRSSVSRGSISSPALLLGQNERSPGGGGTGEDNLMNSGGGAVSWMATPGTPSSRSSRIAGGGAGGGASPSSRPGSSPSRSGSGRFHPEELNCFKRVPTPSKSYESKQEAYWSSSGELRHQFSEKSLHTLPVSKGIFFTHPKLRGGTFGPNERFGKRGPQVRTVQTDAKAEPLPGEDQTARMLNELFPTTPVRRGASRQGTPDMTHTTGEPHFRSSAATPEHKAQPRKASWQGEPSHHDAPGHAGDLQDPGAANRRASTAVGHGHGQGGSPYDSENSLHAPPPPLPGLASSHGGGRTHSPERKGGDSPSGHAGASHSHHGGKKYGTPQHQSMVFFRRQLLDRYGHLREAFDVFRSRVPVSRDLSKKEWRRFLTKQCEWLGKEDREAILTQLNFERDGHLSFNEFHIAVEAAAPVRTFEGLRKRWLASGFTSMRQALNIMDNDWARSEDRLSVAELGEKLSRVHVHERAEHEALFNSICLPDENHTRKVSIAEFASAIASVSPVLLLEDLRDRMLRAYNGNLEKCFSDLDMDFDGNLDRHEFIKKCGKKLQLQETELRKAFREIDVDNNGTISRTELMSAVALCEPSVFLEDLRLAVRQRFRSIQEIFSRAFNDSLGESDIGFDSKPKLRLENFQKLLSPLDVKDFETKTLFQLFDVDRDGELTIPEFVRGIWHFAPSCVLEGLRIRCCEKHRHVMDAFATVEERTKLLNVEAFSQMLADLSLLTAEECQRSIGRVTTAVTLGAAEEMKREVLSMRKSTDDDPQATGEVETETKFSTGKLRVQPMFDLLDTRHVGSVTVGMLIAALQSCGAGSHVRRTVEACNDAAKQDVTSDMAASRRKAADVKSQLRSGLDWKEERGAATASRNQLHGVWDTTHFMHHGNQMSDILARQNITEYHNAMAAAAAGTAESPCGGQSRGGRGAPQGGARLPGSPSQSPTGRPRSNSPDAGGADGEPGAGEGGLEQPNLEDSSGQQKGATAAPRLRTKPVEDLDEHSRLQAKHLDNSKPSHAAVPCAQQSWGNMWSCFRKNTTSGSRAKLEHQTLNYYQSAAWTLSQDTPLVQGSPVYSVSSWHQKKNSHWEALKASHLKAYP